MEESLFNWAGPGQLYGRGIYSTPDVLEADFYAMFKTFKSNKTGKTYKVIMQNRINPQKRVITAKENYWLIPVPEGTSAAKEKSIVEESIRPYGILIKEDSESRQRDHLKIAQQFFQLVGGSASECDDTRGGAS
ncbi:hypothetical protein AOLI_G00004570 [Acnodon oligacanthus]